MNVALKTHTELIIWRPAEDRPDCDLTVVCVTEDDYFCGWFDDRDGWFDSAGQPVAAPLYWAVLVGPKA